MIIPKPDKVNRKSAGCIFIYKNKIFLFHRVKDNTWASISGKFDSLLDKNLNDTIKREIKEEVGLDITPKYITTTYHQYGNKLEEYGIYKYIFEKDPTNEFKLKEDELKAMVLVEPSKIKEFNLFEDEDHCIEIALNN